LISDNAIFFILFLPRLQALAKLRKAELVTGDKEFKQAEGDVKILWMA